MLFKSSDIDTPERKDPNRHDMIKMESENITSVRLTSHVKEHHTLKDCIGSLHHNQIIKFITDGAWSMHHLLGHCLEEIGPSDVYLCTWTLTEDPARAILRMKNEGLINSLYCLFDHRIHTRAAGAHQIIAGIADKIQLTKTHAKVTCIIGEDKAASIVASANYTRNRRLEAGTIFTHMEAVLFDMNWIENELYKNT